MKVIVIKLMLRGVDATVWLMCEDVVLLPAGRLPEYINWQQDHTVDSFPVPENVRKL